MTDPNKLFTYCHETGRLFHKLRNPEDFKSSAKISCETRCRQWNGLYANKPAGAINNAGYYSVIINGKSMLAHRVIWKMVYGSWPDKNIDHINGDRTDNRIENLRCVSQSENLRNSKKRSDNKSGASGVTWHSQRQKWQVRMMTQSGKYKFYGLFKELDKAIEIRNAIASYLGYTDRHGIDA